MKSMYMRINQVSVAVALAALGLLLIALSALYLAGCTDTLDGEVYENQKPIVHFANIPPEGGRFSRNETVYWYGTDPDGLIDYYRYHVAKVNDVGSMAPEDYILTVPDSDWIEIDVDSTQTDPQTGNVIPLAADLDDPVNTYVSQWIFLQAFDMEGLGSDIVFRLFSRNDHPPETRIGSFAHLLPFVNSPVPGGIVTGVILNWSGTDTLDYRERDWPPFEFEWRLYGPYSDFIFRNLVDSFVRPVLVTTDSGRVYDLGDTVLRCRDTLIDDSLVVECTTIVIDEGMAKPSWGYWEPKFRIEDTNFIDNPTYNKLVDSSFNGIDTWILNRSDVIYDVYKYDQFDTTVQMWFMFWIRCRDDAFVADLVPAFDSFPVIDPRKEREVVVIDFAGSPSKQVVFAPKPLRAAYWKNAIEKWKPGVTFDTTGMGVGGISPDYLDAPLANRVPLAALLKHKVIVLYDDNMSSYQFNSFSRNIYTAIDAGINVWATWRVPLRSQGHEFTIPHNYIWYFGVSRMAFGDWYCHAMAPYFQNPTCDSFRIEDFSGAYALDSLEWPNLTIDTALLHSRYLWAPAFPPYDSALKFEWWHPCLPEVNWSVRTATTEVLYLYKSFYGPDHPLGDMHNMEGNPVAHRLSTTLFKTVHFNFTPLAIDTVQMQQVINNVLDWLYPSDLSSPTSKIRYPDAPVRLSVSQARERYWQRCEEWAREEGMQ